MTKSAISVNSLFDTFFSVGESLVDPDKARENLMDVCGDNPKVKIIRPGRYYGERVEVVDDQKRIDNKWKVKLENGEEIFVDWKELEIK